MQHDGLPRQITSREEDVQRSWAAALQTYRTALHAYRRLMEIRVERARQSGATHEEPIVLNVARRLSASACRLEGLTPREREVAELIARGYSNQQIAEALVLTRGTVANHVAHILDKVGAANRTQIAARVLEIGTHGGDGVAGDGAR
jgi:DNA-binding NarL/FixJ family response regulator